VLLVQYIGFILYITFPAGPPRFLITTYDPPRLTGALGLFELTHGAYDRLNQVKHHSSFPSLHCALSLTALLFSWRFRKSLGSPAWFWAILPATVSLWISVVYLRHHWIVDAFAGWALGLAVYFVTPLIRRRYSAFRARVLPVEKDEDLQAAA
jgi:membrane-associated phospholipid phosphatase